MYMNISSFIASVALSLSILPSCGSAGRVPCADGWSPDKVVVEALGEDNAQVIFAPDSVIHYVLGPETEYAQPLEGYYRQGRGRKLSTAELSTLQFLLPGNAANYTFEQVVRPSAPFMPYDEFMFVKGDIRLSVLVSPSDMTWVICSGGKEVATYDFVEVTSINRFLKLFRQ